MTTASEPAREPAPARRRRSSLREAQKDLTREMLVDASAEAFEEHGYVDVTVDDIARGAGASRATFYLHFPSKAAILHAALQKLQSQEEHRRILDHFRAIEVPSVDALQAWLEEYVDHYVRHVGVYRAFHQAQAIEPEFLDVFLAGVREYVRLWHSLGFVADPDDADLQLAAVMLFSSVDQLLYLWQVHGVTVDRPTATRRLAETFHSTLERHRA